MNLECKMFECYNHDTYREAIDILDDNQVHHYYTHVIYNIFIIPMHEWHKIENNKQLTKLWREMYPE